MSDKDRPQVGKAQHAGGGAAGFHEARAALDRGDFPTAEARADTLLNELSDDAVAERSRILYVRGLARVQGYHRSGSLDTLRSGIDDLRLAKAHCRTLGEEGLERQVNQALATALVRLGEQSSDMALLREAISMFEEAFGTRELASFPGEDSNVVNAIAVARLRIGTLTGDRNLVRSVANDLRGYLRRTDRTEEMVSSTSKNLVAALCENARQHGEQRVYRELLDRLDRLIDTAEGSDRLYFLHYRARARIELAELAHNPAFLSDAVRDLEEALALSCDNVSARIELLHSLAQTEFRVTKIERDAAAAKRAVAHVDAALCLLDLESTAPDGRRMRLLSDRASYLHAHAVLAKDHISLEQASDGFSQALELLAVERAPFLFAQMSGRWFYLEYQRRNWSKALAIFARIEAAWRIVLSDPSLSSEATDQRSAEMRGQFARAARCHIEMGNISEAAATLDSGRGLGHVVSFAAGVPPGDGDETANWLAPALQKLKHARRSGNNGECRDAWREFLDLRRRLGLDLELAPISADLLEERVGTGTVLVQVAMADAWMAAIVTGAGLRPEKIDLPNAEKLLRFRTGDDLNAAWSDAYEQFVTANPQDLEEANQVADTWSDCVSAGLRAIGRTLMAPIHAAMVEMGVPPGTPVVLSPPGELAALPLASSEIEDGAVFSERWPTSLVPCTTLLERSPDEGNGGFVVVSTAGLGAPEETLPFARVECDRIAKLPAFSDVSYLADEQATLTNVLHNLDGCSMLHIAAHGRFDWAAPDKSCVFLSSDEQLFLGRLRTGARRPVRLVYLSCCESGISGASRVPDEFVGLLPAFLQMGVEAAIGTLWPVFDDAAMVLTLRFYENLLGHGGRGTMIPAAALAEAQNWLRDARLGNLVAGGYLTHSQAAEIAEARFSHARRRTRAATLPLQSDARSPMIRSRPIEDIRPFTDPIDWAGYIVVGR